MARNVVAMLLVAVFTTACLEDTDSPKFAGGIPDKVAVGVGEALDVKPVATDPQGDPLVFSVVNKPVWAAFNESTGALFGVPGEPDVGVYSDIRIVVSDGVNKTRSRKFSVVVNASTGTGGGTEPPPPTPPPETPPPPGNAAPTISGTPAASVVEGQAYLFTPSASDPNGDALTFSIFNKPAWASFNAQTGALSGTPGVGTAGVYDGIVISVSDGALAAAIQAFTIVVQAPNRAPSISGAPATRVTSGQAYAFTPAASDPDGDALTFRIANLPSWASFNTATGALTGTPNAAAQGVYGGIAISVTDGSLTASLPAFSITVQAANRAPTISGTPAPSVSVGQSYSFTPTASDPDGNPLSFSIVNKPAWAVFNTISGRLSGNPAESDAGEHIDIRISVSDGELSASLPAFSVTVNVPNRAPTISGSPATTVKVGEAYTFTPTASDPDGDSLTFSIANKPAWANFNTSTGRLSGTPQSGSVGSYANIRISVSDGTETATLAAFAIQVQQVATGSVTLSWEPPTARTDQSPLNNLAGYRIRYGTTQGSYPNVITLNNAGLTTYTVQDLAAGTYYFVMSAFDGAGMESANTNPVSKTIQ